RQQGEAARREVGSYDGHTPPAPGLQRKLLFRLKSSCRQTTPWRRPPAHLLRRFLLDRFNHIRLPHAGDARRAPLSILSYYTNKAILRMTIQLLSIDLRQPAVVILRKPVWCVPKAPVLTLISYRGQERGQGGRGLSPFELGDEEDLAARAD